MKIEDLSRILGHANPTVTQNIYVKVFDPELKSAAEGFSISPGKKMRKKGANGGNDELAAKKSNRQKAANS